MWSLKIHPLDQSTVSLAATKDFSGLGIFRLLTASARSAVLVDAAGGDTVRNGSCGTRDRRSGQGYAGRSDLLLRLLRGDSTFTPELTASAAVQDPHGSGGIYPDSTLTADIPMTRLGKALFSGVVTDSISGCLSGRGSRSFPVGRLVIRHYGDDGPVRRVPVRQPLRERTCRQYVRFLGVDPVIPASGVLFSRSTSPAIRQSIYASAGQRFSLFLVR